MIKDLKLKCQKTAARAAYPLVESHTEASPKCENKI